MPENSTRVFRRYHLYAVVTQIYLERATPIPDCLSVNSLIIFPLNTPQKFPTLISIVDTLIDKRKIVRAKSDEIKIKQ